MGYKEALEAAGATVVAFKSFGSYQGDWYALVEYKGIRGFAHGGFGSCSGCDSFEAEFDYDEGRCNEHQWKSNPPPCDHCDAQKEVYQQRLAEFGEGYLDLLLTQEEAEAEAKRNVEWDVDAVAMLAWIKSHAVK